MRGLLADLLAYTHVANDSQETTNPVDLNHVFQIALANCRTAIDDSMATVTSDPLPVVRGQDR